MFLGVSMFWALFRAPCRIAQIKMSLSRAQTYLCSQTYPVDSFVLLLLFNNNYCY